MSSAQLPTPSIRLLSWVIILSVPLVLIGGAVRLLVTDQYLAYEYAKADFPPDPFGFTAVQRLAYASANFRYVREAEPLEALAGQRLDGQSLYNARELKHMQDVQDVYQGTWLAWRIALALAVIAGLALAWRPETRPALAVAVKRGGLLSAGLVAAIGLLAIVAWRLWFTAFHQIFFAPGTWMFNAADTLIRLFPERFWMDAALTISGLTLAGGLALALTGWLVQFDLATVLAPARPAPQNPIGERPMSNKAAREARQRALARQKQLRVVAFAVIVVGVLGLAASLLYSGFARPQLAPLAGKVIDVAADMAGFDLNLIRVKVGQPVTVRLTSLDNEHHTDGGGKHQWAVDELGLNVVAPPEGSNAVTFTPDKPGTYTYYCDICCGGRANPTMQGTLIVEG